MSSSLYLYVFIDSPGRPNTKFIPGSSSGRPLYPLVDPILLIILTASKDSSSVVFRLFSSITIGSAVSTPSAATSPGV